MKAILSILLLSAGLACAQCPFLFDIASFHRFATAGPPCGTGTNNVNWTPGTAIAQWWDLTNSWWNANVAQFDTNAACHVSKFELNDPIGAVTNLGELDNCYYVKLENNSDTITEIHLTGMTALTNAVVDIHTNLQVINITGCYKLGWVNFYGQPLLANLVGLADSTNWHALDLSLCGFAGADLDNIVCQVASVVSSQVISNGTIDLSGNPERISDPDGVGCMQTLAGYGWTTNY